ncbi:MAG: hypothetical protein AB7T38_01505 [Nitrospirales bacterium]
MINILERGEPCSTDQLDQKLRGGSHKLVLSFYIVAEIAAPLCLPTSKTNVMRLLNDLEKLPVVFMHSGIDRLELEGAVNAFVSNCEYRGISPFVSRFDETVDLYASPPTRLFLNYSLAETVWDLYCHGALKGLESYAHTMRQRISADRSLGKAPSLKGNFVSMIERNLMLNHIPFTNVSLPDFANWVYEEPFRCPSVRLCYEVWHKIVKNKTDLLEDSDMEDYQHLTCLPYVELMTLDRRMHGYVSQVSATLDLDYRNRIFKSVQDVVFQI